MLNATVSGFIYSLKDPVKLPSIHEFFDALILICVNIMKIIADTKKSNETFLIVNLIIYKKGILKFYRF